MNTKSPSKVHFSAIALDHAAPTPAARRLKTRRGFGINEVIGIAAGVIIAALVVIPGLQTFAGDVLTRLGTWWNDMATTMFAG